MSHDRPDTLDPEDETPPAAVRPPSDRVRVSIPAAAATKIFAAFLGVVAAGGSGWLGHRVAGGQTEDRVSLLEGRVAEHMKQAEADKAVLYELNHQRERELGALDNRISSQLATISQSLLDMKGDVRELRDALDNQPARRHRDP